MSLFDKHAALLTAARAACRDRSYFSPFPEVPQKYPAHEAAATDGETWFRGQLGQRFELDLPGVRDEIGLEVSPYTQQPLGIRYPRAALDSLFDAARAALPGLRDAGIENRVGACLEIIDAIYRQLFALLPAVMHTTGQSRAMSYAGSGTNALDRGIEAIVHAYEAMAAIAPRARWERDFGSARIALDKQYRLEPRGVAVCFTCATFPTWNALPSMLASLATGNPVIVKPHPHSVLPMALIVRIGREVLARAGLPRDALLLALDTPEQPIGKQLIRHPATSIVDFTGSVGFGRWVERNAWPALAFTETAGVNTVVLDSCENLDAVLRSLAMSLSLFSAQMCTSPQNLFIPRRGVLEAGRRIPYEEVVARLVTQLGELTAEPRRAAGILAAIQSAQTLRLVETLTSEIEGRGRVLRASAAYAHPEFPQARTASPALLEIGRGQQRLYRGERFGPVSFVIPVRDARAGLRQATADVRRVGGLTAFVYSTDSGFLADATAAYAQAGAQLTCNLTGPMPLNFAAAYSDYHVTGLNPAGNASLTDAAFVAGRFRVAQMRQPSANRNGGV